MDDKLNIEDYGYKVLDCGTILGKRGKPLSKHMICSGYEVVPLLINGKRYNELVHRLVAHYHCPRKEGCGYVNHKDGNKLNNSAANLEWCTNQENSLHYRRGFIPDIDSVVNKCKSLRDEGLTYKQIDTMLGLYKGAARRYITGRR